MGSDSRIQTKQPFTNVDIDEWEPGKDFMFAYRPNYKGEETSGIIVSSDGLGRKKDITATTTDMYGKNLVNDRMPPSLTLSGASAYGYTETWDYTKLSYLMIPYYDFNGNIKTGEMVVDKQLADEVLLIFQELYKIKYPIKEMVLVDNYGADDWVSIQHNNTTSFNYRWSNNGVEDEVGALSDHRFGRAIDINPLVNPYITKYWVSGTKYFTTHNPNAGDNGTDRSYNYNDKFLFRDTMPGWTDAEKRAKCDEGTEVCAIFEKYGWKWGKNKGGDGKDLDIQHFDRFDLNNPKPKTINWDEILKEDEEKENTTTKRKTSSISNRALSTTKAETTTTTGKEIEIPSGLGSVFTYEPWQEMPTWSDVNYKNAPQGKLVAQAVDKSDETNNFDEEGFGKINGRYVIACTTTFGVVGDYIDFYQSDGTVFHCIIGDIKSFNDAGCTEWGHKNGNNVIEFLVNGKNYGGNPPAWSAGRDSNGNVIDTHTNPGETFGNTGPCHPEWGGKTMVKAVNLRKLF